MTDGRPIDRCRATGRRAQDRVPSRNKEGVPQTRRQHHPDAKPGDTAAERRFKEANEANEVLSDPAKRKQYDELGANWEAISRARQAGAAALAHPSADQPASAASPVATSATSSTNADPGEFSDFFRMFFGEEAPAGSPSTGGRGSRPTGGLGFDDILSGMGIDGRSAAKQAALWPEGGGGPGQYADDPTRPGFSNAGHPFLADLGPADAAAVIEYLKTL
jgi:curved DNA-binding protein CbpA